MGRLAMHRRYGRVNASLTTWLVFATMPTKKGTKKGSQRKKRKFAWPLYSRQARKACHSFIQISAIALHR